MYIYILIRWEKTAAPPWRGAGIDDLSRRCWWLRLWQLWRLVDRGPWFMKPDSWCRITNPKCNIHDRRCMIRLAFFGVSGPCHSSLGLTPESGSFPRDSCCQQTMHDSWEMHDFLIWGYARNRTRIDSEASLFWGRSVYWFSIQQLLQLTCIKRKSLINNVLHFLVVVRVSEL